MNTRIIKTNIEIVHPELSYKINGLFFNVHNRLGRFCREKQYADELEVELKNSGLRYKRESRVINENGFTGNVTDFIIEECIVLELKSKPILTKQDCYQAKRYLISTGKKLCLLVNFRDTYLKPKRVLNNS